MRRPGPIARVAAVPRALHLPAVSLAVVLSACAEPPDDTPLGRDIAAVMARPEQAVQEVQVQHVLVAFVGAKRGSESKRTYAEARALTEELLARARAGENFPALMQQFSADEGGGTYTLTPADRGTYAADFTAVAYRLAVGEVGAAAYHRGRSPFGFHVIKRLR
jgi:parvulin-like peptidyl-prolyl isomerase